jgi:ubiquinone biosynthesis protein COQ9
MANIIINEALATRLEQVARRQNKSVEDIAFNQAVDLMIEAQAAESLSHQRWQFMHQKSTDRAWYWQSTAIPRATALHSPGCSMNNSG